MSIHPPSYLLPSIGSEATINHTGMPFLCIIGMYAVTLGSTVHVCMVGNMNYRRGWAALEKIDGRTGAR